MENINEVDEKNEIQCYIYFIESHHFSHKTKVYLSSNYPEANSIEKLDELNLKKDSTTYNTTIYRFKISPFNQEDNPLKIIVEDQNQEKNETELSDISSDKNKFLYDFNSNINIFESKLSFNEEFDIYISYLKDKINLSKDSKEFKDFFNSTFLYLSQINKNEKIDFPLYISLFLECYNSIYFTKVLELFNSELINDKAEIPQNKIDGFKSILNNFNDIPNFNEIDENLKEKITINLYTIIYFFCLKYDSEKIPSLYENINIQKYIFFGLINHRKLFYSLILPKNIIIQLVKVTDSLNLNLALSYNRDFITLLKIINENIELFNEKIDGQEKCLIKLEKLISPKKDDNIHKIYSEINTLLSYEKKYNKKFVKFSPNIFDKYIILFDSNNYENINIINNIIKEIKKDNPNFEVKNDPEFFLHENTIFFSKQHKLSNMEILNFIKYDKFYNDDKYNSLKFRSPEIVRGINIAAINPEFIDNWNQIDFLKIFNNYYYEFLEEICNLFINISYFGILFDLLNRNKGNKLYKSFDYQSIALLQKTFNNLLKTYDPEKCPNFIDDVADLIYYTDQEKFNVVTFLSGNLQINLNNNLLNAIYFKLLKKYNNISEPVINTIIEFITQNSWNTNVSTLLELIKLNPTIKKKIMTKLDKYVIKEDEFFEIEETNNYKLLSGLLDSNNFFQNEVNIEEVEYLEKSMMVISLVMQNVKNLDLNYNLINYFVINNKEDILYNRLLTIFLLNEKEAKKEKDVLIKNINVISKALKELQSSLDKITLFFPNKYYKEIIELNEVIKKIKLCTIKSYVKEYSYEYNNYITKFRDDVEKIGKRSESYFFITVYNNIKSKNKYDDENCFSKAINQFKKMKDIFTKNKLTDSNDNLLEMCLKPFKNKEEQLKNEIDIDIELLNIKKIKDKNKLFQDIIILLKREDVMNIMESLKAFISLMGAIKGEFSKEMEIRLKKLQKKKVTKVVKAFALLLKYGINIEKNENNNTDYLDIITLLKNQPDSLEFLNSTSIEDCRILQELPGVFENGFLSMDDILNLEKCVDFTKKVIDLKEFRNMKDIDMINKFRAEIPKFKNINVCFAKFINNYALLNDMMKNGLDRAEMSKNKVSLILEKSEFTISNVKDKFFNCIFFDQNKNNINDITPCNLTLKDLFDLRDRAQLNRAMISKDDENAKEKEKIVLNNKKFIELVSEINNLYGLLQEIYWKGYFKDVIIKINIENNNIIYNYEKKDYDNFKEIILLIKDILEKIKEQENLGYKERKYVRYFFGLQFKFLYKIANIKKKQFFELKKLLPFLQYVTNELIEKNLESFDYKKSKNEYQDIIINSERFIKKTLKLNKLSYETIYKDTLIERTPRIGRYKGIYTYLSENMEKDVFQIYKYFTHKNPVAQNILLCNKDSTKEEIAAFLYRAILCEFSSCFLIGGIETLKFEQRKIFYSLLNNLYIEDYKKMRSCLFILHINNYSDTYKWLELERTIKKLDISKEDYKNEIYEGDKIEVIYSDKSGVGKSTKIKNDILNKNKRYIYFPFGGVLKRDEILERLQKLELDNNCIIHIDLYDTDQPSLMMEFLFSALITKVYGKNDNIFYLSKEIEIKIEVPNSFIDFFAKFPILNLFPKTMLSIDKLSPLIVSEDLSSNIQIVCNYLKDLKDKNIDKNDLIFPGITPEDIKTQVYFIKKQKFSTAVDARVIPQAECQQLIFDIIKSNYEKPTYYQINSFIDVLAVQLKAFNQSFYLNARQLRIKDVKMQPIRTFIVESFIKLTKHFTEGAFTALLQNQEQTHKSLIGQYNEEEDINNAINNLANNTNHEFISYDKINPSLLFFHEGDNGQSFSIITNKNKTDKEYIDLLALQNSQARTKKELIKELPNYKKYTQKQFLIELKDILDIKNPVEKEAGSSRKSLEEICGNYVFTADNFVKMVLILLRIRSNIPVIMMGETGCGKTSLIRKLAELKNDGNAEKMKILNIHAGTNDNDIINFITEKVMPESVDLSMKELERRHNYEKMGLIFEETKIWVFLDEINTCKSMGLISELMCKHTYQGNPVPSNVVFIAACNPYRQRENKGKQVAGLNVNQAHQQKKYLNDRELEDIKRIQNSNLVYTVNPLPHSLLNFVFDFGILTPEDEEDYIKCMIKESIEKKFNENRGNFKDSDLKKLINLTKDMIVICHKFIRDNYGISSVSLREIRRFNIFYEFFYDYIKMKKKNEKKSNDDGILNPIGNLFSFLGMKELDIHLSAINLSIFICYYMRITNKELRGKLYKQLNDKISLFEEWFSDRDFLEIPISEEKYIVDNIQIEKGIAKNKALLENIFSLFVAINNKVPIFIVGKPGCSKSLSVQLITRSMRGYLSNNPFFKELPKVIVNSYQGSMGSTSEGVENVFKKARKVILDINPADRNSNISMIYFDEMGLAEHSPNNPLKVIHAELEYDLNEGDKKVAFVGISNWSLDASKMNRGIFISIPEPDEEDMKETALTIGKSYNEILADKFRHFFENLGKVYYEYKNYLKSSHSSDGKEDFHGNRDFYHLIKNASMNLTNIYNSNQEIDDNILCQIGIDSIERNFSGIEFKVGQNQSLTSLQVVKNIYKNIYPNCQVYKEYDVSKRITENIFDINSRYLLIIANSSISSCLLSSILIKTDKNYSFFIGSEFEEDHKNEEYSLKVLNKVQLHMEQGNILILNNLESVYPNLYDLFNQNFTVLGNKNYARLAVGSTTNTFSFVNNNFRCIVNVDIDKIENEEAPFLNRFEKHILSYEYLLNQQLIDEANKIHKILKSLVDINPKTFKGINYDFSKLLINCTLEEIQGIVYEANNKNIPVKQMINEVLSKVALVLPQDILYGLKHTKLKQEYRKKIVEYYNKGEHINLANFIKKLTNKKNIVYTFSHNMEAVKNINNIDNKTFGHFENENITQIEISSLKSENELERQLDIFYSEEKYKICFIKIRPHEGKFMNYLKYFIDNKEKYFELNKKTDNNNSQKIFIFIVHVVRIFNSDLKDLEKKSIKEQYEIKKKILNQTLSNLTDYYQTFIDNLNGTEELSVDKILKMKSDELFTKCLNIDRELLSSIFTSLTYINYNIISSVNKLNQDTYIKRFMHLIRYNARLRKLINDCIIRQISKEEDIITKIYKKPNSITSDDIDLVSIIIKYLSQQYAHQLNLFVFRAEKDHFFSSILSTREVNIMLEEENNKKKKKKKNTIINTSSTNNNIDEDDDDFVQEIINTKEESLWDDLTEEALHLRKDIAEMTKEIYLKNLMFNEQTRITEKLGANKLKITLGLKLPGLKTTIDKIIKKVKEEVIHKYDKNEDDFRRTENIGEKLENDINTYKNELKRLNDITNLEIESQEILNIIAKEYDNNIEEINKFYDLLLNDYYTLFINNIFNKSNNNQENNQGNNNDNNNNNNEDNNNENAEKKIYDLTEIEEIKKMLKLLVELKIKYSPKEEDFIKQIGSTINWVEVYTVEITSILKMYITLNKIVKNLYEQIRKIIDKDQVKFEISERNPEHRSLVNKAFFIALESLLRVITSNEKIYTSLKDDSDKYFELINIDKQIHQDALLLNTSLSLYSKEVFSLQEILIIVEALFICEINSVDNLTKTIKFFSKQTNLIIKGKNSDLKSNLKKLYEFLFKNIRNNKLNYGEIMNSILWNEFIKIVYDEYRIKIIEIILENIELIPYSTKIMTYIVNNTLDHSIKGIPNNLDIIHDSKSKIIKMLNSSKKIFVDEMLINIFETKINLYFDLIQLASDEELEKHYPKFYLDRLNKEDNPTGIILDQSFYAFRKYLDYLELAALGKKRKHNSHIIKLYALTYVKIYLSKFVYFLKEKSNQLGDISEILKVIKGKKNNNFRKVIKIYIFKLFYSLLNNYEELQSFNFKDYNIDFATEFTFSKKNQAKEEDMLNFYFLPLDTMEIYQKYMQQFSQFEIARKANFPLSQVKIFADYIKTNGIDIFLAMSINKIISNLGLKIRSTKKINEYHSFSLFTQNLLDKGYIFKNQNMKTLLSLFFDENIFTNTMMPIFKKGFYMDQKLLEIILYSFRYCVSSLSVKEDPNNVNKFFLYESLLSNDCLTNLKGSYIPGCDLFEDLRLVSLDEITKHLNTMEDRYGCYVCSCGYYYVIEPCGFPSTGNTSNCPICGEGIGWGEKVLKDVGCSLHGMVVRPGHYRIFKDANQKEDCMNRYHDPDENIPNKTLEEYKRDVIEPILKKGQYGLNIVSKQFFMKTNKKVRNLSEISFRLLHFITYSHLFFANFMGCISDYLLLNNCLVKEMTCLQIIEKDWDIMKDILNQKGIQSIQVFMNLIFGRISDLIKNCVYCSKEEDRNILEDNVESVINQCLLEYKDYSAKYETENKNQLCMDHYDMKTIICELTPPNEKIYKKKEYPLLKYFMLTKYKSKEDFIKKLGPINYYITKYPLIGQYLLDKPGPKKMKYLPDFNEFTNYMVDYYSFKISRDDAKKRILNKEEIFNDPNFKNKYDNFIDSWDEIKSYAIKYKCRPEMPIKNLSHRDTLINFLNDDGELQGGMYIAAACQNFISWQNSFLQPIIDTIKFNGILHYYVNHLQKKIPLQSAKINQTLLIEDCFNKSQYKNFLELIYTFSKRNIFKDDGTINYINYNSFIYDYAKIEEEFGKLLLPGVCLFENEDILNFIAFWSEGYRGGKSDTLSTFYTKYPQIDLNDNEKQIIMNYISSLLNGNYNYNFKGFFSSLQLLIFYLANNNFKKTVTISDIINKAPPYLKISDDCLNLFKNEGNQFTLDKLMNIFFFIEHLCFKDLIESLQPEYRKEISDEIAEKIREKLFSQRNPDDKYTIGDLAAAVRRYISRYLVGKRQTIDINEDRDLPYELSRIDLWEEKFGKLDDLEELISNQIYEFKLKVGQAYAFYQIIAEEDKIGIFNIDYMDNNNDINQQNYNNINFNNDINNMNFGNNNIIENNDIEEGFDYPEL